MSAHLELHAVRFCPDKHTVALLANRRKGEHTGHSAQDLISVIESKAVSLHPALSCQKWILIECCVRYITGSPNQKSSYLVMNSTGGQMLQRMGRGKQNEKAEDEREGG